MKKILVLIGIIMLLSLSSCAVKSEPEITSTVPLSNAPSATITITPTASQTPRPTATPEPTNSSEPTTSPSNTAIPENLLSEDGPWLMYWHEDENIFFVNQDGTGKTNAPFSTYLAFITSTTNNNLLAKIEVDKSDNRITSFLNIYKLPDFELQQSIDLQSYLIDHQIEDEDIDEIRWGAGRMVWSPNGRYLAFTAAIDGPSIDLYVYDAQINQATRLTSGENQVGYIFWSPNSQWIVHEEVLSFRGWGVNAIWAAASDRSEVRWLYQPKNFTSQHLIAWLDNSCFLTVSDSIDGIQNARITDLYSNESNVLYSGFFARSGPIYSPDLEIIAFNTLVDGTLPIEDNGLYMMDLNAPTLHLVSHDDEITIYDENIGYFMTYSPCQDEENGVSGQLGFKSDGILTCVETTPYYQDSISPDGKWTLDFEYEKVRLLDSNGEEILIERGTDYEAYWRSDSAGFFLVSNNELYYVPIDSPELTLIDSQLGFTDGDYNSASLEWIGE